MYLKNCPFCGKKIENYEVNVQRGIATHLLVRCCMSFEIYEDDTQHMDAVERWNIRAFDVRC